MLCIIPPGSNGCARAALCRLESCFYAGGHWGVCFCKRGSVCRVQKGLLQGVLCDPGLAIFSIVLWGSALSCFLKPGRSFRGCFCVWCAFTRLCCFTGGSWLLGGSKTGGSSFHNLGRLGLCTFIGRLCRRWECDFGVNGKKSFTDTFAIHGLTCGNDGCIAAI